MSLLSSLLVQKQILGVTEIEAALQRQVLNGGDLATNLLEMNLVDESTLLDISAQGEKISALPLEVLDSPDPKALSMLPWRVVNEHRLMPVRIKNYLLTVAVSKRPSDETLERIAFLFGIDLNPQLVLDYRLAMALNRVYGIPFPQRLNRLQSTLAPKFVVDQPPMITPKDKPSGIFAGEDPRTDEGTKEIPVTQSKIVNVQPPGGVPQITIEGESHRRRSDDATQKFHPQKGYFEFNQPAADTSWPVADEESNELPSIEPPAPEEPIEAAPETPPGTEQAEPMPDGAPEKQPGWSEAKQTGGTRIVTPLTSEEVQAKLKSADDRDSILALLTDYTRQLFEFVAFFRVHGTTALGRNSVMGSQPESRIDHLSVPLDQGGMFETVFTTRSFYLGPVGATDTDELLLGMFDRAKPRNCVVLPVNVRHRIILLIYGESGALGVGAEQATELFRVAQLAGEAFERLLIEIKARRSNSPAPANLKSTVPPRSAQTPAPESAPEPTPEPVTKPAPEPAPEPARQNRREETEPLINITSQRTERKQQWAGVYHLQADEEAAKARREAKSGTETDPEAERRPADGNTEPATYAVDPEPAASATTSADPSPTEDEPVTDQPEPDLPTRPINLVHQAGHAAPESSADEIDEPKKEPGLLERDTKPSPDPTDPPPPTEAQEPTSAAEPQAEPVTPEGADDQSAAPAKGAGRSVVVAMKEEIDHLVDRILNLDQYDETAAELLVGIGDDALVKLATHFPGPLHHNRYLEPGDLPPVEQHGPVLKTLLKFGKQAVPHLLPLLNSISSDVRFYATYLFSELVYPEALTSLVSRLFDNDRQIRLLATEVIKQYTKYPEYRWAIKEVANILGSNASTLNTKRVAAEVLGELGEPLALEVVSDMLGSVDSVLAERCYNALVKITFNDFGFSRRRWMSWWKNNRLKHRIEWAIESLNHNKAEIQDHALSELKRLIGDAFEEWPDGPLNPKKQRELKKRLLKWWKQEGSILFPNLDKE